MDPMTGRLYESPDAARAAGVLHPVEVTGTPEQVQEVSAAVKARAKAKRKAQRRARKANR